MNATELLDIIASGETSTVQFKENLDSRDGIAAEIVAMANSRGGKIIFGVKDRTGEITGLEYAQLQSAGNLLASIATDSVKPQIFITTEVVSLANGQKVLVVHVPEGTIKPYKTPQGVIWLKQGSDKRKLTDNNEQIRLFQQSGLVYTDEIIVPGTAIADVDKDRVANYLEKIGAETDDLEPDQLYHNLNILKDGRLTLAGLLFFGRAPQRFRPAFCVKAIAFFGNDIAGTDYRGSKDIVGTIPSMFEQAMGFLNTYLWHTQQGQDFNSHGILEISNVALVELVQNALTHRDYSKNAPVRILVFDDRVEIVSPGPLPNSLTVANIRMGNAVVRNPLVVTYASRLLPYRGIGSGIRRALREQTDIEFVNDVEGEQFSVIIPRPQKS